MTQAPGRLFHRLEGIDALQDLVSGNDLQVLQRLQNKPALGFVPGRGERPPRMIATLLHGNEDSGFRGACDWLRSRPRPPGDVWLFIGNVRAATEDGWFGHRYLDDQEDFNRVWGIEPATTRMRICAAEVLRIVTAEGVDAGLDVHNNTGDNPLYAILPTTDPRCLELAGTLAEIGLVWGTQQHTLMQAISPVCPAVALECGLAGLPANAVLARRVIDRFVAAPAFDGDSGVRPDRIFQVTHRVEVRPEVAFDFGRELTDEVDVVIRPGLDRENFGMLTAGTMVASTFPGGDLPFVVTGLDGQEETERFFTVAPNGDVVTREDVSPAMMTRNAEQTRRDCLFYVVRRTA